MFTPGAKHSQKSINIFSCSPSKGYPLLHELLQQTMLKKVLRSHTGYPPPSKTLLSSLNCFYPEPLLKDLFFTPSSEHLSHVLSRTKPQTLKGQRSYQHGIIISNKPSVGYAERFNNCVIINYTNYKNYKNSCNKNRLI